MREPVIRRSGPGWCACYPGAYVWAVTKEQAADDVEQANIAAFHGRDAYESRLAREAEQQAIAEFLKLRARA
jgi:hypothetical protein